MSDSLHKPSVVICHLREDKPTAREVGDRLAEAGAEPWMVAPSSDLGEDWEELVETAVRGADALVVLLRPGFETLAKSQDEVRAALRVNRQVPYGPNFLVPYILQPVDGDQPTTIDELVRALNLQCAGRLTLPGLPAGGRGGPSPFEPAEPARGTSPSPPRPPSRSFSAASPQSQISSRLRFGLGSLLVILLLGVGYWYWPEGRSRGIEPNGAASPAEGPPAALTDAGAETADRESEAARPPSPPPAEGEEVASALPEPDGGFDGRVEKLESPNKMAGRAGLLPQAIVIHSMDSGQKATQEWQMSPKSGSSMHYAVGLNGRIVQYVQEGDTAFHLGRQASSTWEFYKPGKDPNLYTIGIDHESLVGHVWPERQVQASAALIRRICTRWGIPIDRKHVLGHQEAFPLDIPVHRDNLTVKPCPGTGANLDRLVQLAASSGAGVESVAAGSEESAGAVTIIANLKIRGGAATTSAPTVGTVEAGRTVRFVGWTEGQRVGGNPYWYRDAEGNYFWAGGTSKPDPTAP